MYLAPDEDEKDLICPISMEDIVSKSRALYQCVWYGKVKMTAAEIQVLVDKEWTIKNDTSAKYKCHKKYYDLDMLYEYIVKNGKRTDPLTRERFSSHLVDIVKFKHAFKNIFINSGEYKFRYEDFVSYFNGVRNPVVRVNTQMVHLPFLVNVTRETTNEKLQDSEWIVRGSRVMGSLFCMDEKKGLMPRDGFYVLSYKLKGAVPRHIPFKHIHGHGYVMCKYFKYVPVEVRGVNSWFPCITDILLHITKKYKLYIKNAVSSTELFRRL